MSARAKKSSGGERFSFEFTYNGRPVTAYSGDSIASALVRAGVHVFSRSLKFHRPRGLYCGANRCYSCAMRVNGIPGVRTCSTRAESGMIVETENGFPSARFDLLSALDHVFRNQFDYHSRFIRPRFLVPAYQRTVRKLASARKLPDRPQSYHHLDRTSTDVLVVGHGISGTAACDRLRELGVTPLIVDRLGTAVFPPSIAFGYYEDGLVGVITETGGHLVTAKAVVLATGRIETGLDIVNADLPGVLLPEAVEHLAKHGVSPGERVFIVGKNELGQNVNKDLDTMGSTVVGTCEDAGNVKKISGMNTVKSILVIDESGKRKKVACDSVVLLGPLVPYVNLAQQAGCDLIGRDGFWFVKSDLNGRTSIPGVFSCGSVTGRVTEDERRLSGLLTAESVARFLGVA